MRGSVTGTSASEYLNKALRVLVVFTDGTTTVQKVYAPFAGATLTYKAKNTTDVTAIDASAGKVGTDLGEFDIPANDTTAYPMVASVYVYFEGEDANCKSKNLKATLDELNVELEFGLIQAEY